MLDTRFKDKFFSGTLEKNNAKQLLDEKVDELTRSDEPREPSPKRPRSDVLKCIADVLQEAVEAHNADVDKYLAEPLLPFHKGKSLAWWAENEIFFQAGSKIFVCTSNLCSIRNGGAGEIFDPKRNCLAPERAELLLFVTNNLALIGGNYNYSIS